MATKTFTFIAAAAFTMVASLSAAGQRVQDPRGAVTAGRETSTQSMAVEVREVFVSLQDVRAAVQLLDGTPKGKSPLGSVIRNKSLEAARLVLMGMAQAESTSGKRTVVAVIGSDTDKDKVVASLADVTRKVLVLWANTDAQSDVYDNTVLRGSFLDRGITLQNVLVYVPNSTSPENKPKRTLSSKVLPKAVWLSIFGAEGDMPTLQQITSSLPSRSAGTVAGSSQGNGAAPVAGQAGGGFRTDEIVVARINGVKVSAQPDDTSRTLATLTRGDELIVTGVGAGDFVKVQSASVEGWIKKSLVAAPAAHPAR